MVKAKVVTRAKAKAKKSNAKVALLKETLTLRPGDEVRCDWGQPGQAVWGRVMGPSTPTGLLIMTTFSQRRWVPRGSVTDIRRESDEALRLSWEKTLQAQVKLR